MEEWHVFSASVGKCIVDRATLSHLRTGELSKLTGICERVQDAGSPDVCIEMMNDASPGIPGEAAVFSHKNRALLYDSGEKRFRILHDGSVPCLWLWKFWLFCACLASTLRRGNCMMMHGVLLEMPDGSSIALCGPPGMGKSTTARRWIAAGGICRADDLFWLVWRDGGVFAYPLPTWSRCEKSLAGEFFPVDHGTPLKAVLALGRGKEKESIIRIQESQFLYDVYASAVYFEQIMVALLPSPDKEQFVKIIQQNARKLAADFPAECLLAHLEGDLRATLHRYEAEAERRSGNTGGDLT